MALPKKRNFDDTFVIKLTDNKLIELIIRARIKQLLEIGWSQSKIKDHLKVSRSTVSKVSIHCSFDNNKSFLDKKRIGRSVVYIKTIQKNPLLKLQKQLVFQSKLSFKKLH